VVHSSATIVVHTALKSVGFGVAAWMYSILRLVSEFWSHWVAVAMVYFSPDELLIATGASKLLESGKHLPEDILPSYLLRPEEHNELIDIPMLVTLMLSHHVTVKVYKNIGFRALVPFPLIASIQSAAVDAPMKHIVLLLKQAFQLLHVNFACKFVFLVQ
jgi:hypothetical protein